MQVVAEVSCPVHDSFRVRQVAGMFDLPVAPRARESFQVELPDLAEDWQIGLIVGPSGSGKSTVARQVYGQQLYDHPAWPADRAVIDALPELPIGTLTGLLTAVGFSSPPAWLKPYQVLSGGEQFRCDLAWALAGALAAGAEAGPVVFDEFTSVVDRTVAQFGSAAISKAIRRGRLGVRFVAVTCHYDVAEWLSPDWTLDMASRALHRRRLRRGAIELRLHRCRREVWSLFKRHHYLSGRLNPAARCYLATWRDRPVAFCALLPQPAQQRTWRVSRVVTLPDFQGLGVGMRVVESLGDWHAAANERLTITAAHPAVIAHCRRSARWQWRRRLRAGGRAGARAMVSFAYVAAGEEV